MSKTTVWTGDNGPWLDPRFWTNGVPGNEDVAIIHNGSPRIANQNIGATIDIRPDQELQANVLMQLRGHVELNDLKVQSTENAPGTVAILRVLQITSTRTGTTTPGDLFNTGKIDANPTDASTGAVLNIQLNGTVQSNHFWNEGAISVNDSSFEITRHSPVTSFVDNLGRIDVDATTSASHSEFIIAGGIHSGNGPVEVDNEGAIAFHGATGAPQNTIGAFDAMSGTGFISIEDATVRFDGPVQPGGTLRFIADPNASGVDNMLALGKTALGSFGSTITGFGIGDRIDIDAWIRPGSLSYDSVSHELLFKTGAGIESHLNLAGSYQTSDFQLIRNGDGSTSIAYAGASPATAGFGAGTDSSTGGGSLAPGLLDAWDSRG